MENTKVTLFENIITTKTPHYLGVFFVFERIRTGGKDGKVKELVEKIRAEQDYDFRAELKKQLPCILFSGIFKYRGNNGIDKHSGLIALDFDKLESEKLSELREKIKRDKYTLACFTSPSGNGIKVIVKIPAVIEDHKSYLEGLKLYYKESAWDDLKDVARVCYDSYDPDIYVNKESEVFDIKVEPKVVEKKEVVSDKVKVSNNDEIYNNLKVWVEKNMEYIDGAKYNFLVYFASACNRFGLPQEFAEDRLYDTYSTQASHVPKENYIEIVNRIYISYVHQHGTSFFDKEGDISDFDPNGPVRDVIYVNDIRKDMVDNYENGQSKGETTYFPSIDEHWTWRKGEVTLMGGIGNHGKSSVMLQLMLLKSVKEGKKWGIFSPEQNPPIDFYNELIHAYMGQSTEKWHSNRMSMKDYEHGMDFMMEHFFFVYPKDESPTPQYINDKFGELIVRHGIEGCMIDPFNQLDNDYGKKGRDDIYISNFLTQEKRFALNNNVYKIIVAHPNSGLQKNNDNNYACPDVYDFAGGAMWNNKCDNILVTYRPYYTTDKTDTSVEFHSQKIKKQKLVGIPGMAELTFDRMTARFLEDGQSPFDAKLIGGKKEEDIQQESSDSIAAIMKKKREEQEPESNVTS